MSNSGTSYAEAGVDIAAGETAVELMKASVAQTHGPTVVRDPTGFAGLVDASALRDYRRPLLATSTDGVGTKVAIAQALDIHDTIGFDLVGMCVDDLVVGGAKPLFLTDYIACGTVVPERIAAIVRGIADACLQADCALVGGEVAEHPGLLEPDAYDLAGAATGVVEADELLGPDRVQPGDVVLALASSGLHSNGFSLVRKVIGDAGWSLDRQVDEFGRALGEELLEPTRIYAGHCQALTDAVEVHAMAHVTGGGISSNLARVIPPETSATLDRATWTPAPVFSVVGELGAITREELEHTLNMGVGMVVITHPDAATPALSVLAERGVSAWIAGRIESGGAGAVSLTGEYAR